MKVTEEQFKSYLETFHKTLRETSNEFLSEEHASKLLHNSLLPAKITGYVSTKFGIAIEYQDSKETIYETIRGSKRVEELFFNVPKKILKSGNIGAHSSGRNFTMIDVTTVGSLPLLMGSEESSVKVFNLKSSAPGWERNVKYAEFYGNRESEHWDEAKAISRAKDEVLAALYELEKSKSLDIPIDEYIATKKEKHVLLLGDYSEAGKTRLHAIRSSLIELEYQPIIVEEVPDNPAMSLSQKVILLASLSRFIIIDDSSASGHLSELSIVKNENWVTVLLHANGERSSFMTAEQVIYSKVMFDINYDPNKPNEGVSEAAKWAENKNAELSMALEKIYPWRIMEDPSN